MVLGRIDKIVARLGKAEVSVVLVKRACVTSFAVLVLIINLRNIFHSSSVCSVLISGTEVPVSDSKVMICGVPFYSLHYDHINVLRQKVKYSQLHFERQLLFMIDLFPCIYLHYCYIL